MPNIQADNPEETPQPKYRIYRPDSTYIDLADFISVKNPSGGTVRVSNDSLIIAALLSGLLMTQVEIANATWELVKEAQGHRQDSYERT
jgi:hypothetical protein